MGNSNFPRELPIPSPSANPAGFWRHALTTALEKRSTLLIAPFGAALLLLGGAATLTWFLGSRNPFTPAGYVGYLTKGALLGKAHFEGVQRGPTSAGRTWLLDVTNVSITPYTYAEEFSGTDAVLSRDNLKIAFRVHTVWRIDETKVPLFLERYSTTTNRHDVEKDPDTIVKVAYGPPTIRSTRCARLHPIIAARTSSSKPSPARKPGNGPWTWCAAAVLSTSSAVRLKAPRSASTPIGCTIQTSP